MMRFLEVAFQCGKMPFLMMRDGYCSVNVRSADKAGLSASKVPVPG